MVCWCRMLCLTDERAVVLQSPVAGTFCVGVWLAVACVYHELGKCMRVGAMYVKMWNNSQVAV
jgi:hypothetical protein